MTKFVLYSGGMDSFTLLNKLLRNYGAKDVHAISYNYGQRHVKELSAARKVAEELGVRHTVIDLSSIQPLLKGSALTDSVDVPEGHYSADNMKITVVPGRNTIMLSIAMGIAEASPGFDHAVYYAAHVGDHTIYSDCRPEYISAMQDVFYNATEGYVSLVTPFSQITKIGILKIGLLMGLDYGNSWTCYKGEEKPCGVCGACVERAEAFALNNAKDPLYA